MALARKEIQVVDEHGNVQPGATVEVRREVGGQPLEPLYSDRDGVTPIGNPVTADSNGVAAFHCLGGAFQIAASLGSFSRTQRYVPIGTASEGDLEDLVANNAAGISFTPAGSIAATDVQAAIAELDSEKEPADSAILKADESETLTVGYVATPENIGTITTGTVTPDPATCNFKHYVNNGAHTLAPPSAAGAYTIVIQVTNGASAGAVTTSGYTNVTGDILTTVNGDHFLLFITKLNGVSDLHVRALQ